jgi:hypothetical protein
LPKGFEKVILRSKITVLFVKGTNINIGLFKESQLLGKVTVHTDDCTYNPENEQTND